MIAPEVPVWSEEDYLDMARYIGCNDTDGCVTILKFRQGHCPLRDGSWETSHTVLTCPREDVLLHVNIQTASPWVHKIVEWRLANGR